MSKGPFEQERKMVADILTAIGSIGEPEDLTDDAVFLRVYNEWMMQGRHELTIRFERTISGYRQLQYSWKASWFVPSYQNECYGSSFAHAGLRAWHAGLVELGIIKRSEHKA